MDLTTALLDSWDRQARIVKSVAGLINETNQDWKPSEDGWSLDHQLAHIHQVRQYWLAQLDADAAKALPQLFSNGWEDPTKDLDVIKQALDASAAAVRAATEKALAAGNEKAGFYDNGLLFLQHMVWHEGWHVGLIFLGLRLGGQEPAEEWEEANVWGEWRTEVW